MSHTKGKWIIGDEKNIVRDEEGYAIAICSEFSDGKEQVNREANARLIAASPFLLKRLKLTDNALKEIIKHYHLGENSGLQIALEAIIKYNDQAIAAAEGGE